jgi:hypothetical protein
MNGVDAKTDHKKEIADLMFTIRKCLILVQNLPESTKAFLLMTLDLYYSNFNLIGDLLNNLYGKYLIDDDQNNGDKTCDKNEDKSPENGSPKPPSEKPKKDESPKNLPTSQQDERKDTTESDLIATTKAESNVTNAKSNAKSDNSKNSDPNSGSSDKSASPKVTKNNDNVLKQNGNSQKHAPQKLKIETGATDKAYFKEENMENLTWEALAFEDETSPQKNPYSMSFMNFLSSK